MKFSLYSVIFLLSYYPLAWTDGQAPSALTWEDCVVLAGQNNPDFLGAQHALEASQSQRQESLNVLWPRISLANSYTESHASRNPDDNDPLTGPFSSFSRSWQAAIRANLDFLNVPAWAGLWTARARVSQAEANLRLSSAETLLVLYRSFAGLLYAQEQVQVAGVIRSLLKNNAQMINLRYESGRESKGNKMRTDAQLLQAEADLSQADRDLRVARQDLGQALGRDVFEALVATGTWNFGISQESAPDIPHRVEGVPRVQAQEAALEEAKAARMAARGAFWPAVSLGYSRGYEGNSEFPRENPSWSISGVLNLPLFGNGPTSAYYANRAARQNLRQSEEALRSAKNQAMSDLEAAWSDLARARDQARVQQAFLEAARQRRRESDVRYQNGLMSFEEWQFVVADLVNFEKSALKSQESLVGAEAQWRFAQGRQLGEKP